MFTQKEKLAQLMKQRDPNAGVGDAVAAIMSGMTAIRGPKGDKGDAPKKGVDYFTPSDIDKIASIAQSKVKSGPTGLRGGMGLPGSNGKDGRTPMKGTDYWTLEDQASIIKEVVSRIKIPKAKDGVSPNMDDIIEKTADKVSRLPFDFKKILGNPELRMLMHGGGLSSVTTDGTLTGMGTALSPLSVVGATGTAVYGEVPTGSATAFAIAHTPVSGTVRLYRGGSRQQVGAGNDYTISGKNITLLNSLSSGEVLLADYNF